MAFEVVDLVVPVFGVGRETVEEKKGWLVREDARHDRDEVIFVAA